MAIMIQMMNIFESMDYSTINMGCFYNMIVRYGFEFIDYRDKDENTPLLKAISYGRSSLVEILLRCGANINDTNRFGKNALQIAVENGDEKTIRFVLNKVNNNDSNVYLDSLREKYSNNNTKSKNKNIILENFSKQK